MKRNQRKKTVKKKGTMHLQIGSRHLRRLLKTYEEAGMEGLIRKPSRGNRSFDQAMKDRCLYLIEEMYSLSLIIWFKRYS